MNLINKKGETIVEVLVSVLIAALCFVMLQVSIVSSAKINKKSIDENTPFSQNGAVNENIEVNITRSYTTSKSSLNVQGYKTSDGYYYYE